jgi:hypothetical protein
MNEGSLFSTIDDLVRPVTSAAMIQADQIARQGSLICIQMIGVDRTHCQWSKCL